MAKPLDEQQNKLLNLIKADWGIFDALTLREVGEMIGIWYAQWVLNKLKQLENRGYVRKDESWRYVALMDPAEDVHYVPLIGFARCGNLRDEPFETLEIQERIPFPTKMLAYSAGGDLWRCFFTKAKGDSMEPVIKNGDLLLIRAQPESTASDKTLLIHGGTPKIKHLKAQGDHYILFSLNKDHEEVELSGKDDVTIVGVVKLVISNT